ncbi:MAG: hypothetical protein WBW75_24915 [Mycobacterium sp.]|uniref:hypothetical protein n=1 Tax=Mycobacterium sp. TaxID=1785 RepID=UPI003C6BB4E9
MPGALGLADGAARLCLQRAKRTAEEVDLLINAGVYNDRGISEPAIASLIQEDIGANPEQQPGAGQGTFSFDVRNGGCGMLSGIELVDGMLASGTVKLGLVVASDIDPEPGVSEGFGFPAVGGAVLLSADDSRAGFTAFRCVTFRASAARRGRRTYPDPCSRRHGTPSPSRSGNPSRPMHPAGEKQLGAAVSMTSLGAPR